MNQRQQSSTSYPIVFLMVDSTNHITGKTGLTVTVTLSKDGGSFSGASGAVSEISSGWYKLAANATDRNTLGALALHATASGADPHDSLYDIVAFDPFAASTTPPTAAAIRSEIDSNSTQLAAIKAKTDNLPSDPADASDIASSFSTVNSTLSTIAGYVDTEVAAIKAKTDQLSFTSGNVDANINAYNSIAIETGVVVTDAGNTALTFKTDRTESATDFWKDAFLRFNSGALAGQCHRVSGYNGSTKFLTVAVAFTAAPSNGDTFEFINR